MLHVNNLQNFYENSKIFVKLTIGEKFSISSEAGVKQDDALSPRLFCIALNRALRKANLERFGERYGNTCIPYLGLADDLVLIAPSIHKAQKMLEELTYQTSQKWVKGKGSKRVKKLEFTKDPVIKLNGEMLEKVETYIFSINKNIADFTISLKSKFVGHWLRRNKVDYESWPMEYPIYSLLNWKKVGKRERPTTKYLDLFRMISNFRSIALDR
uniref:Reverse transcriptase domain-containing protein n=1 Tax=Strongyloides papillosus TaxID=174720 RepID=A0A0N5C529_STREA